MTIKFRAFAKMEDEKGENWRVNISDYNTEEEAKEVAEKFMEKYKDGKAKAIYAGVHKYYIISRKEWANEQYKGVSIEDGKTKTWMTNEGNGCVLLFEGVHFEIK